MRRRVLAGLAAGLGGLGGAGGLGGLGGLASLGGLALPQAARAQATAWPTRPARFIVGLGPGSGADTGTRFVAERFTKVTGQPATVENRPGGDGIIAVQTLLQAPPDGHTLMYITPSPMVLTPMLRPETPYDPLRDVRPVAFQSRSYSVIVTGANSRFKTLPELIAEARARPNTVKMSNYGHHYRIGGLSLQKVTGAEFIHVAYKGAGQANNDVIAGDIDIAITDHGGAMPLIEAGKLRPLAMTSPTRHRFLPNVPTARELGIPFELMVWVGYGISAKVPEPVARRVEEVLLEIIRSPEFAAYNERQGGAETVAGSGEQLRRHIESEFARYRELARTMSLAER